MRRVIAIVVLMFGLAVSAWAGFDEGMAAYWMGRLATEGARVTYSTQNEQLATVLAVLGLLRIDGEVPVDLTHVSAVLAPERDTAAFVELERQRRRWGVLIPARENSEPSDG